MKHFNGFFSTSNTPDEDLLMASKAFGLASHLRNLLHGNLIF